MKLNSEGVGGGGGCRIMPLPPPETVMTNQEGLGGRIEAERIYGTVGATKFMKIIEEECNSSSSSSIGNNSDDDDDQEGDAQSPYRYDHQNNNKIINGSLDDAIQALEEALPIRRGISTFYNGKSKSFTCLADMWPSSTQEIAKPDNPYTRKRRNLVASTLLSPKNKNHTASQLSSISMGRISKKTKTSTLRFVSEDADILLKKQNMSSMRSFSMVNLHRCGSRFVENC